MCGCYYPSASFECPCDLAVAPKMFLSSFLNFFSMKRGFLGRLFSGFVVLYLTHSFQLLEICCSDTAFSKQRLAFADFCDEKIFLFGQVLFKVRIVTSNLLCHLMVVFCLISPDFAKYSLALHRHLVSVVVKRFSTFASLALSILAPIL